MTGLEFRALRNGKIISIKELNFVIVKDTSLAKHHFYILYIREILALSFIFKFFSFENYHNFAIIT